MIETGTPRLTSLRLPEDLLGRVGPSIFQVCVRVDSAACFSEGSGEAVVLQLCTVMHIKKQVREVQRLLDGEGL